jgi:hypothetical protein
MYDTIRDNRETVFPVPDGISSTQCPYTLASSAYTQYATHSRVQGLLEVRHVGVLL